MGITQTISRAAELIQQLESMFAPGSPANELEALGYEVEINIHPAFRPPVGTVVGVIDPKPTSNKTFINGVESDPTPANGNGHAKPVNRIADKLPAGKSPASLARIEYWRAVKALAKRHGISQDDAKKMYRKNKQAA